MLLRHNDYFCDVAESDGTQMSVDEFKNHPRLSSRDLLNIIIGPASNFDFQPIEVEYVKDIILLLKLIQGKQWDVTTYCKDSCAFQLPPLHSR